MKHEEKTIMPVGIINPSFFRLPTKKIGLGRLSSLLVLFIFLLSSTTLHAQNPPRVVLQSFWWDYWNSNYPNGYYNYLTELAPRLKDYGIDAVWIPPTTKGGGGTNDVGYGVFDHYDLGDKYQKGDVRTRLGTKDEYLRMVAVMHANGIDIIQDVVLNHVNGAGPLNAESDPLGKGGQDPNAPDNKWKNFRYTSYSHPATDESPNDYLNRNGRWPKNYQNFHKSGSNAFGHNDYDYPQHGEMFGPDICYKSDAINVNGTPLSAATYGLTQIYNPAQPADYMKQQAIEWGVWMKKQTGIDGVRLDANKHFEWDVTEGFLWNLQNGSGLYGSKDPWANGGNGMFAVSEYIPEGGQPSMEQFIDGTQNRTGTFDFNLRDGIYGMVSGSGFYDISSIPGAQIDQNHRARTVSFVNNHDTFRPQLDASGNYTGWNTGNELRPHIDPFVDRLPAAYAIISAVDGSPQVFFEDLFNIGGTGKRYSHLPTSASDLPSREKIANIIWARRALNFAGGSFKVRSAEAGAVYDGGSSNQDLLIIERSGKAVIGVNDNGSNWQGCWVDTDFTPGTTVKDYSGANGNWTYLVDNSKRVHINVPPANAQYGGYSIIAPIGFDGTTFNPVQRTTTQEWEMSDDLGDSHPLSLKQGGAVPQFGIWLNPRTVGRIFCEAGKNIHLDLYPTVKGKLAPRIILMLSDADGTNYLQSVTGSGNITLDYMPNVTGYYTIKIANGQSNSQGQNVYVKATYTAPQVVNTSLYDNSGSSLVAENEPSAIDNPEVAILSVYPNPASREASYEFTLVDDTQVEISLINKSGEVVTSVSNDFYRKGAHKGSINVSRLAAGTYILKIKTDKGETNERVVVED